MKRLSVFQHRKNKNALAYNTECTNDNEFDIIQLQCNSSNISTERQPQLQLHKGLHKQQLNTILIINNNSRIKSYKKFTYKALNQPGKIDLFNLDDNSINSEIKPNEINRIYIFPYSTILTKNCDYLSEEINENIDKQIEIKLKEYSHRSSSYKDHDNLFKQTQIDYCRVLTDYYFEEDHSEIPKKKIMKISKEIKEISHYINEIEHSKEKLKELEKQRSLIFRNKYTMLHLSNNSVLLNEFQKILYRHKCKVDKYDDMIARLNLERLQRKRIK